MKIQLLELPLQLINVNEMQTITTEGEFQSIVNQKNSVNIYFNVRDKKVLKEVNDFWFVETGKDVEIPKEAKFLTTLSFDDGNYILHVYKQYVYTICDYGEENR